MRKGGGRGKGKAFENFSGRKLSLWLTRGKDGTQLISSRQSGGWKHRRERHAGDLAANGPAGERFRSYFLVECKHHNKDILWGLFYPSDETIPGWWKKAEREAEVAGLVPMMICRQNSRPMLLVVPPALGELLAGETAVEYQVKGQTVCTVLPLDVLFSWKPEVVYSMIGDS